MRKIILSLIAFLPFALATTVVSAEEFIRIVSGPSGGSWYPLGAKIAEVLGKQVKGIATSNAPGGGVGNVRNINKKAAEIGWTYAHTAYEGSQGTGKFKSKQTNARHFASLYPAGYQTAVRRDSKIRTYSDLKNKRISPGLKHFSGNAATELLLGEYGITYGSIKKAGGNINHVSFSDSVALMKDGHIDAFLAMTSVPQASFKQLNFKPGIRFLGIEKNVLNRFLSKNKGYIRATIPTSAYDGMKAEVPTIGAVTTLVISKDVPNEIVYQMTKALWDNHAQFVKVKGVWKKVKLSTALSGAAIPVHPGAKRYYDEKGVK
ncbi:MAG: TAXI family TRAP transporter solute-binding subunit [Rhodospirillales bacterium]|jgi:hypothetical protein|nr:TAXI family TRAP transporter solute-binding subunit [Rhodospirillales bacterium]MDP6644076.1 TAXI family TRAP transporter solute-binding subunit [Rhodospirillales bacterium]|tara:strand:+ start:638 stop:1594 length:957 start_codon:yes stop_codon:yes gene_type:complete